MSESKKGLNVDPMDLVMDLQTDYFCIVTEDSKCYLSNKESKPSFFTKKDFLSIIEDLVLRCQRSTTDMISMLQTVHPFEKYGDVICLVMLDKDAEKPFCGRWHLVEMSSLYLNADKGIYENGMLVSLISIFYSMKIFSRLARLRKECLVAERTNPPSKDFIKESELINYTISVVARAI